MTTIETTETNRGRQLHLTLSRKVSLLVLLALAALALATGLSNYF